MGISIFIPITVTILGIIYMLTISRLTDVIPVLGFLDDIAVIILVIGFWIVYFAGQAIEQFADILTQNPVASIVALVFIGIVIRLLIGKKQPQVIYVK